MPFISHSMMRNLASKVQPALILSRTMATLSDAQKALLRFRFEILQQHLHEENETIKRLAPDAEWQNERAIPTALGFVGSKNRRLVIEREIFEVAMKLAEDKKD